MKGLIASLLLMASMSVSVAQRHPDVKKQWHATIPTHVAIPVRDGQRVSLYLDCFLVYPELCAGAAEFSYGDQPVPPVERNAMIRMYHIEDEFGVKHEGFSVVARQTCMMTVYANVTYWGDLYSWTLITVDP